MPAKAKAEHWGRSTQKTHYAEQSALRGIHRHSLIEPGSRKVNLAQFPPDFAERVRQQRALTTDGLDEGLAQTDKLIEGWKQSL